MSKQLVKYGFVWGFVLWLIGYILGIVFFAFVPKQMIGWVIMPIGTLVALWVLLKKVKGKSMEDYLKIAAIWTLIAIVFDYLFLVKLINPEDGYYKLDVYLYYLLTFALPTVYGWKKSKVIRRDLV